MSRIVDLIAEFCQDGVEYVPVGDLCDIHTGNQLNKDTLKVTGEYPVYNGGIYPSGYHHDFNAEANTIAISQGGASAGYVNWVDVPFYAGAHCYTVKTASQKVLNRYLYFFLKNEQVNIQNAKHGAGIPGLNSKAIKNLQIPLPPLPVQDEIVRLLDNFTEYTAALTAELTSELTTRKKQYEYYFNSLFVFSDRPDIKYMPVGELFEFKNGLNKGKEYFGKGTPIVNFTDVFKNRYLAADMVKGRVNVTPKEIGLYSAHKGDVFFTRTSESQEEIGMVSVLIDNVESCVFSGFVLRARPKTSLLLPKYSSFCFSSYSIRKQIIKNSTYTTRALTSGTKLSKLFIPVPPIEEQEQIVAVLDSFDALYIAVTKDLHAEIEARRKQYEHYRDKLLTFKEIVK